MYYIYTAVLGFGILRRSTSCIHAVVRAVLTPQGGTEVLALMYRDVLYAGFAGVKTGHKKYPIFGSTLYCFKWNGHVIIFFQGKHKKNHPYCSVLSGSVCHNPYLYPISL